MNKRASFFILPVVVLIVISCAQSISRGSEYGKITVAFGPSRALETGWPSGTVPTFNSVTVTVSASDMSTVTANTTDSSGSLTIQVPAGSARRVEIVALPAADGGAPDFATAYSGSATVDIAEGETKNVSISLSLSETKVLLPTNTLDGTDYLYTADSLSASRSSVNVSLGNIALDYSDFEFDKYGRIYVSISGTGILRYSSLAGSPESALPDESVPYGGLAYQSGRDRLFYTYSSDGWMLGFLTAASGAKTNITLPDSLAYLNRAIATDESFLYVVASDADYGYESIVAKVSVNNQGTATLAGKLAHYTTGLAVMEEFSLEINDMYAADGVLYVAADQTSTNEYSSNCYSRGKIIAFDTATMTKLWETGWRGDNVQYPTGKDNLLVGPKRFVGVSPKKLYVVDDGYYLGSDNLCHDVDRVVEIDKESGTISAVGLSGAVAFFESFEGTPVPY